MKNVKFSGKLAFRCKNKTQLISFSIVFRCLILIYIQKNHNKGFCSYLIKIE